MNSTKDIPPPPPPPPSSKKPPEREVAYAEMLRLVKRYKSGELTWVQLEKAVVDKKFPPHPQGCGYLLMVPPPPPPGVVFDPTQMPYDWKGTWGEVAMTMLGGPLKPDEYERLHKAAHANEPGFPNCKR